MVFKRRLQADPAALPCSSLWALRGSRTHLWQSQRCVAALLQITRATGPESSGGVAVHRRSAGLAVFV
eukprot:s1588_g5.t1